MVPAAWFTECSGTSGVCFRPQARGAVSLVHVQLALVALSMCNELRNRGWGICLSLTKAYLQCATCPDPRAQRAYKTWQGKDTCAQKPTSFMVHVAHCSTSRQSKRSNSKDSRISQIPFPAVELLLASCSSGMVCCRHPAVSCLSHGLAAHALQLCEPCLPFSTF